MGKCVCILLLLSGCGFAVDPLARDRDGDFDEADDIASLARDGGSAGAVAPEDADVPVDEQPDAAPVTPPEDATVPTDIDAGPGLDAATPVPDAAAPDAMPSDATPDAMPDPPDAGSDAGRDAEPTPLFTDGRICTPCSVANKTCGAQSRCLLPQGRCVPIRPASVDRCRDICDGSLTDAYDFGGGVVGCAGPNVATTCDTIAATGACF